MIASCDMVSVGVICLLPLGPIAVQRAFLIARNAELNLVFVFACVCVCVCVCVRARARVCACVSAGVRVHCVHVPKCVRCEVGGLKVGIGTLVGT